MVSVAYSNPWIIVIITALILLCLGTLRKSIEIWKNLIPTYCSLIEKYLYRNSAHLEPEIHFSKIWGAVLSTKVQISYITLFTNFCFPALAFGFLILSILHDMVYVILILVFVKWLKFVTCWWSCKIWLWVFDERKSKEKKKLGSFWKFFLGMKCLNLFILFFFLQSFEILSDWSLVWLGLVI